MNYISERLMKQNKLKSQWREDYDSIITAGTAKSTRRAYSRDVSYFWIWAKVALRKRKRYPVSVDVIVQFILDHIGHMSPDVQQQLINSGFKRTAGPLKISTQRRYLASISISHQEGGHHSPVHHPKVRILLRRARQAKANQQPNKKVALTRVILRAMVNTCDNSLAGVRDKAILLVGFSAGGRQRDELSKLTIDDLSKIKGGYLVQVTSSKTDQVGKGLQVPVRGQAATALSAWLVQSGLRKGYLFRGIRSDGNFNKGICGRQ